MSFEASLKVGDGAYTYYPVSEIEGAAQLPYSLTVLLENALRCGRTPEEAQAMAERIVNCRLGGPDGRGSGVLAGARVVPGLHGCAGVRRFRRHARGLRRSGRRSEED